MRILNDVELTLIRSEMYLSIAETGNITANQVKAYRDFVIDIQEYTGKTSMIVRNILNAVSWNIANWSNDYDIVCKNYRDLLQLINDNVEPINIDFFYNLFTVTCSKYNNAFINAIDLPQKVEMLEITDAMEMPIDYINEVIDLKNILLRSYLDDYQKYSHKVSAASTKIKELIIVRKGIDNLQFELFN